jgi:hypothetical protein
MWKLRGGRIELWTGPAPLQLPPAPILPPAPPEPDPEATTEQFSPVRELRPPEPTPNLNALHGIGLGPRWRDAEQTRPREADPEELRHVLDTIPEIPEEIADTAGVERELNQLLEAVSVPQTSRWVELPRDLQRALVGHVVARARRVQDELAPGLVTPQVTPTLDRIFSHMTAYSKREQPGFVFGLMRNHAPTHQTWLGDSHHWWRQLMSALPVANPQNPERLLVELQEKVTAGGDEEQILELARQIIEAGIAQEDPRIVRLMVRYLEPLKRQSRFKRLRKAVRELMDEDAASEAENAVEPSFLETWSYRTQVEGRRAVIVGGDLREEARCRIERAFGFSSAEWVTTDHSRNLQTLASGISGGTVDFVIVLRRFIGHDVDRIVLPAARAANVPWISVDRGYGVNQIRLAVERFLSAPAA